MPSAGASGSWSPGPAGLGWRTSTSVGTSSFSTCSSTCTGNGGGPPGPGKARSTPPSGCDSVGLIGVQNALRHEAEAGLESFDCLRSEVVKHWLIRSRGTVPLTPENAASICATWSTQQWS